MQNQPNLAAKYLYEVLIDFDSLDGIIWEIDEYWWSTVGQNPVFKMAAIIVPIL